MVSTMVLTPIYIKDSSYPIEYNIFPTHQCAENFIKSGKQIKILTAQHGCL